MTSLLNILNHERKINFIIVAVLLVVFSGSIYLIGTLYKKKDKDKKELNEGLKQKGRFILPFAAMAAFFISCCFISKIIVNGNNTLLSKPRDQYIGIYFMFFVGFILTIMNLTVLKETKVKDYIKGKKFSVIGVLMALGVSAIVFGFLDNFGMKLGTDALDDSFLQMFLSPFSTDVRFKKHKKIIAKNLQYMNNWASGKWRSVINQLLRHKDEIISTSKKNNNSMKDLVQDIKEFIDEDAHPLDIPDDIKAKKDQIGGIKDFVRNIKDKYDVIDGSKSMLGNTFSDFIGAILGAGIINLFIYMTSYDSVYTGDDNVDESFMVRNLNKFAPFMEAGFIALGCLVPVFLNIAMTRDAHNNNNTKAWIVVGIIAFLIVVMMYLSVFGIKDMTNKDKKRSIKKTLNDLKDRLDIDENKNKELFISINQFLEKVENIN